LCVPDWRFVRQFASIEHWLKFDSAVRADLCFVKGVFVP
jgi:hypothetical protein